MEPWVPQWPSQPRGRPIAPTKDPDQGLWKDGYHRPVSHPRHNGEGFYQRPDTRGSPQPHQDLRAEHQQPRYTSRPGEWHQPVPGADYYQGGYPGHLYSRPGYEDPYQSYRSPSLREEYAYGSYYYRGHPQWLQEERVPRQGSPYIWHEDHRGKKYLSEPCRESQSSPFGTKSETQFQPLTWIPDKDSPASTSGQERPGELFSESLRTGAQKNKPSLSSESNLLQQHESGLSSSSYELSQYMADTPELYDPTVSVVWSPGQAGGYYSDHGS